MKKQKEESYLCIKCKNFIGNYLGRCSCVQEDEKKKLVPMVYECERYEPKKGAKGKKCQHIESSIQISCVSWFRVAYRKYSQSLFSVPNGGKRNAREASTLKKEGVLAGVSDLLLLLPRNGYHGLCIEMKQNKTKQSDRQVEWGSYIVRQGYKYIVCRSFDEFKKEIEDYFKDND